MSWRDATALATATGADAISERRGASGGIGLRDDIYLNVAQGVSGLTSSRRIGFELFETRQHFSDVEFPMDSSEVTKTRCSHCTHGPVLVARKAKTFILDPPPVRFVECQGNERLTDP